MPPAATKIYIINCNNCFHHGGKSIDARCKYQCWGVKVPKRNIFKRVQNTKPFSSMSKLIPTIDPRFVPYVSYKQQQEYLQIIERLITTKTQMCSGCIGTYLIVATIVCIALVLMSLVAVVLWNKKQKTFFRSRFHQEPPLTQKNLNYQEL